MLCYKIRFYAQCHFNVNIVGPLVANLESVHQITYHFLRAYKRSCIAEKQNNGVIALRPFMFMFVHLGKKQLLFSCVLVVVLIVSWSCAL